MKDREAIRRAFDRLSRRYGISLQDLECYVGSGVWDRLNGEYYEIVENEANGTLGVKTVLHLEGVPVFEYESIVEDRGFVVASSGVEAIDYMDRRVGTDWRGQSPATDTTQSFSYQTLAAPKIEAIEPIPELEGYVDENGGGDS